MIARIRAIEYHLPEGVLTNDDLEREFPDFPARKIKSKTGISRRPISGTDECASDLAYQAAVRLLDSGVIKREEVEALVLCTQTPDQWLPTTACTLQARLGLPTTVAALDFNLGCSGFVYGLGLAKGLIETGQVKNVLLLTADTYTKLLAPEDRSVRALFGDGAAATLLVGASSDSSEIGPFVYGTDGNGGKYLTAEGGGLRRPDAATTCLQMNGPEIFNFTLDAVPAAVSALMEKSGLTHDDVDLYVFHQANAFMLEHLRETLELPEEKFFLFLENTGNTVSSTIPIALKAALNEGRLKPGMRVMLVGFGVGLSWAGTMVRWA